MSTRRRCDSLFDSWFAARESGANPDFEALCAAHPECADDLRARLAAHGKTQILPAVDTPTELRASGPTDDPGLLLVPPPSQSGDDSSIPLLQRLSKRGAPRERFRVEECVGRGGMGAVFRVYDAEIGRDVAAKVMHDNDPAYLPRFLEEAQITGQLDHPAFIPVHDFAVDEKGRVFFTMKLVKGFTDEATEGVRAETLSDVIDKIHAEVDGWNLTRGLSDVIVRVAEAMEFAHEKGVVHRDIKPSNILVGRYGEVYVTDFGIARVHGKESAATATAPKPSTVVRTERREAIERGKSPSSFAASSGSPGPTEEGSTIGTAEYMPPEQAEGRLSEIGPRSDIYSLGATLYQLIAGVPPWHTREHHPNRNAIVRKALAGAMPPALHELAPDTPAELLAIVEKAMASRPGDRYESMDAFAADLRAYLERRVVSAYETGAFAELKKWVHRNPALASAAGLLILVLAGSAALFSRKNSELDARNTALGKANLEISQQKQTVERASAEVSARKAEFDQLAGVVYLEMAERKENDLYPAWPNQIPAMLDWLASDAARLVAMKPTLERTIRDLESRALPQSEEESAADRRSHPQLATLEASRSKLTWLRWRSEASANASPSAVPTLPADLASQSTLELHSLAWKRCDPDFPKRLFGEEPIGLACALEVVKRVEGGDPTISLPAVLDTLAWSYFANGRDAEARAALERATSLVGDAKKAEYASRLANLGNAIARCSGSEGETALERLASEVASLEAEVSKRWSWTFREESERFLYTTLTKLLADIATFESGLRADVEQRLAWAERIGELTLHHPNARVSWDDARAAIAKADGVVASPLYAQAPDAVRELGPQMGLVPIGMNPVTKLWEFYELRSACDWQSGQDPASVAIPTHRPDGSIEVKDDSGIVFVLVPGGTSWQGSQKTDPAAPNFVVEPQIDEVLQRVTLDSFFLARHELTRAQWYRLSNREEPSINKRGISYPNDSVIGWSHPVENVDWRMCDVLLRHYGMTLPTEARWEYAARAGTVTPWWTGNDPSTLAGAANVLDLRAEAAMPRWGRQEGDFDDGFVGSSAVGSLRANPFGMHDMYGNLWEWCLDAYETRYGIPRRGDGLRFESASSTAERAYRGGGHSMPASSGRSSIRARTAPTIRNYLVGARAARSLDIGE